MTYIVSGGALNSTHLLTASLCFREMEAENKMYADMHGVGQVPPPQYPPQYTPSAVQNPGAWSDPSQGYQPYPSSAVAGAPYYAPPSGQQQQQQQVIVATGQAPVVYVQPVQSFSGAIMYSCFVLWCCNFIFGLIGYVLASEYSYV